MIELTEAAAERLEEYLRDVRAALRAAPEVDADEIERDVREHVEAALGDLEGADGSVSRSQLDAVLRRLGKPADWVPEEEVSPWRRAVSHLQRGPEDWRLAYLTITTCVLGLVVMQAGAILLPLSFLLARAAVSVTAERGEALGARRWLLYPPLLLFYLALAVVLVGWPAAAAPGAFARVGPVHEISEYLGFSFVPPADKHQRFLLVAGWGGLAQGLWWVLLGGIARARRDWVRFLFRPFAEEFSRRHAGWIVGAGAGVSVLSAAFLILTRPAPLAAHPTVPQGGSSVAEVVLTQDSTSVAEDARKRFRRLADRGAGIQVALVRDGELLWSEAFGAAEMKSGETATPMTEDTRLRIYSVSKPMTATAAGRLMERGRLDPGAPVQRYVPSFPVKSDPITVTHLLGHTSGIRHYRNPAEARSTRHCDSVEEGLRIFADDSLVHRPGARQTYSTWGYVLLSAVIEGVTGRPYPRHMSEEVFRIAGMEHTVIDDPTAEIPDRASFYSVEEGEGREIVPAETVDNSCKWGGGAWLSTAEDVARFFAAAMDGRLISREMALQLTGGGTRYEAMGLGAGGMAFVRADLESRSALVVLSNGTGETWGPRVREAVDEVARELLESRESG